MKICVWVLSFSLIGCASWIQEFRHNENPSPETPVSWFQVPLEDQGVFIKAGYSEADLTPYSSQWLAGYAVGRKSQGVAHPLRAQCLALKDRFGQGIMFVSLDLLGVLPDFTNEVLSLVNTWPKNRILFSCSHTHSAPDIYGIWGNGPIVVPLSSGKDLHYIKRIQKDIALAIEAAAQGMQPAQISFASGEIPPGIARGRKNNPPDGKISLMQIRINGNSVTLANFALHPDVMEGKYVSSDFVHFLRQDYEAKNGGRLMYVNGAVGGVQPRSRKGMKASEETKNGKRAQEIGSTLAEKILSLSEHSIVPPSASIRVKHRKLPVQLENLRFRFAISWGLIPPIVDSAGHSFVDIYHITIGCAKILTAPGELFPERWAKIRPKLNGHPTFLFGLTNVGLGYIMSLDDFNSGNHQYHTTMALGAKIGEDLLDIYEELLEDE